MKIRFFKAVRCPGDWELGFIGKRWQLRIARSQFALWRDHRAVVDWRYGHNRKPVRIGDGGSGG